MNEAVLYKNVRVLIPANQTFGRSEFEIPSGWKAYSILSNTFGGKTTIKNGRGDTLFNNLYGIFLSANGINATNAENYLIIPKTFDHQRIIVEHTASGTFSNDRFINFLFVLKPENNHDVKYFAKEFTFPAGQTNLVGTIDFPQGFKPIYMVSSGWDVGLLSTITIKTISGNILIDKVSMDFFIPDAESNNRNYSNFFKLPITVQQQNSLLIEFESSTAPQDPGHCQLLFVLEPKLPIKPPFDIPVPHHSHHAHHPNPEKIWKC